MKGWGTGRDKRKAKDEEACNRNRTKRVVALQSLDQYLVPESDGLGTQLYHCVTKAIVVAFVGNRTKECTLYMHAASYHALPLHTRVIVMLKNSDSLPRRLIINFLFAARYLVS
jgi:hypothetical protein